MRTTVIITKRGAEDIGDALREAGRSIGRTADIPEDDEIDRNSFLSRLKNVEQRIEKTGNRPMATPTIVINLRMPPELHARILAAAQAAGLPVTQLLVRVLDKSIPENRRIT